MNLVQIIAKYIIFIEFLLISVIVLMAYFLKIIFYYYSQHRKVKKNAIEVFFKNLIQKEQPYNKALFPSRWQKIDLILPVLNRIDKAFKTRVWQNIKVCFMRETLLPIARVNVKNKDWVFRLYAAEAFSMYSEKCDENSILSLLDDPIPVVSINAINAAVLTRSKACFNKIVLLMSEESWLTQSLFLKAFTHAPTSTRFYIEEQLINSHDQKVRMTCYNILLKYDFGKLRWDISKDFDSEDINLKIAAIKYFSKFYRKSKMEFLLKFLEDKNWEIRMTVLNCLGQELGVESVQKIAKFLDDPNEWVRLAAAKKLYALGEKGKQVLASQDYEKNPNAFYVASLVLKGSQYVT